MGATPRRKTRFRAKFPDLGALDVCLDVKSVRRSAVFYEKLGFAEVEGDGRKSWAVVVRGETRIGLFQGHIESNLLNFRGGDVEKIVAALRRRGLSPFRVRRVGGNGSGSALLKDPDGNVIFFDTTPSERNARKRAARRP